MIIVERIRTLRNEWILILEIRIFIVGLNSTGLISNLSRI